MDQPHRPPHAVPPTAQMPTPAGGFPAPDAWGAAPRPSFASISMPGAPPAKKPTSWVLLGGLGCLAVLVLGGGAAAFTVLVLSQVDSPPEARTTAAGSQGGESESGSTPTPSPEPERFRIPVLSSQPAMGPADAPVTIVEFGDFQCPFTARANGTIGQLMAAHPGQVRVVWRHSPLATHALAPSASVASLLARQQGGDTRFWQMHGLLLASPITSPADFDRLARRIGLNMKPFRVGLRTQRFRQLVDGDRAAAQALGVTGTPTFFINGRRLSGALPLERFQEIVNDELVRTRAMVARGVAPERVYDEITANGRAQ